MSDRGIEVNDRRMFLPDGSLRSEYSYLEDESRPRPAMAPSEPEAPEVPAAPPEPPPDPAFLDLIEMVAQNAAAYLAQANAPGGAQYLAAAKGFLGMLEAVHRKTEGNLAGDEKRLLADVIGRLNLALAPKSSRG